MPESANTQHGDPLMRLRIGPAQATPDGITGAENRRGLFVGDIVGNQEGGFGVHEHVLGVPALKIDTGIFLFATKHFAAALAPFAAPAGSLNPRGANTVADFPAG